MAGGLAEVKGGAMGYEAFTMPEDPFGGPADDAARLARLRCWCHTCRPVSPYPPEDMRMVLCPDCGNKRCPRANDHRNACTGSNEAGQPGSAYA